MRRLVQDIIILSIFMIIILSCRNSIINKMKISDEILANVSNYNIDVDANNEMLYLVSDEYARNNMVVDNIKISGNSGKYNLYMRLDNSSTLDVASIKILVNDREFCLSDLYDYEVDGYTYYNIYSDNIIKEDNISFKLWLSNSLVDNIIGNELIYTFVVV